MGWKEAARLSRVAFSEVALQATYALRQGNPVPPGDGTVLVDRSRRRVEQSKALIAALLGILALGGATLLRAGVRARASFVPVALPTGLFQAGVLTGLIGLEVALLWWTGLQALPTFVGSSVVTVLAPLPIDRRTLRQAATLVYLRLFDLPAAVVLVATPLFVGLALGPVAGLLTIPACLSAVVFALALSLLTGRFFVRRVQASRGGGGGTVLRWAFLLLWLLPAFGLLIFVVASPPFFRALGALTGAHVGGGAEAFALVYPFALALWPPYAAGGLGGLGVPAAALFLAGAACAGYVALTGYAAVWLYRSVADLGLIPPTPASPRPSSSFALRPQRGPWAILTKDLRLASRTPGYAFLLLLPLLDAAALGLVTYAGAPGSAAARGIALGAVSAAAILATFFGPAFFALEVIAQSYARTLPLAARTMALGKVALIGGIYVAAGGIVLALTALRTATPELFLAFVLAELPAVLAAGLLEISVLFRWGRARGLPVVSLYSGTWNILLIALPGVVLAGLPLLTYLRSGLGLMAVVSVLELAVIAPLALRRGAT